MALPPLGSVKLMPENFRPWTPDLGWGELATGTWRAGGRAPVPGVIR